MNDELSDRIILIVLGFFAGIALVFSLGAIG